MIAPTPMRSRDIAQVYIGWDPRDHLAYKVACRSLLAHASVPINITPLVERDLRRDGAYWRPYSVQGSGQRIDAIDGRPYSTEFTFTRFLVPHLEAFEDRWVLFCDADVMFRDDVALLWEEAEKHPTKAVLCVQHDHKPREAIKMDGVAQSRYPRKNWSSVMMMHPARCCTLTVEEVNSWSGRDLHGLKWIDDAEIGPLPERWNWLEGHHHPGSNPALVHYTRGTPDMTRQDDEFSDEWWGYLTPDDVDYPLATQREADDGPQE